ncbi:MAG TPA: L,D-transpeptidase [Phycisphaerae bacterium]|nr:L,D-transpeptidase [Phycisphaerae bacterium]
MKMYTQARKTNTGLYVTILALAGVLLAVVFWPSGRKPAENPPALEPAPQPGYPKISGPEEFSTADKTQQKNDTAQEHAQKSQPVTAYSEKSAAKDTDKAYGPKGMTVALSRAIGPSPLTTPRINADAARQAYAQGWVLYQQNKDYIQARTLLNRALNSGFLAEPQAVIARKALEDLANRTVLNPSPYVNPKDPYLISYKFKSGDTLNSIRGAGGKITREGIISHYDLCVPARMIPYVNGFGLSARNFQAGRNYKLVRGPFHVVVYKSKRVADLYLQDLFLRRVKVAVGLPETPTPEGFFRVVPWNGKTANSTYYPPADSGKACIPIMPGQPGYPLGPNGYNIKIEGIPQLGTHIEASQSYALHGTCNPSSLGTQASRGCVRFSDRDIEFLFIALMDYADPKDSRANWPHWSTITILP